MGHLKTTLCLCLAVLGLCISTDASAQVRNSKTSVKKTTTTQRKTSTVKPKTSSTQSAKVSQKATPNFAFYAKLGTNRIFVGDSLIYYVEDNHNNAVMAIDRKTGEKSVIIPGIDGVYEGARKQVIKKYLLCGGRQFVVLKGSYSDDDGVYLYEGSVKQARLLENSMWLLASNDRYIFVKSAHRINGVFCCELWDAQDLKVVQRWAVNYLLPPTAQIAPDGSVWIWTNESEWFGVTKLGLDGKITHYKLSDQPYIVENEIRQGKNDLYLMGDYLYNRCYRRIYRINTAVSDAKWEEYAKIPPTQNSEFVWYCIDSKGNMLTCGSSSVQADYRCQYWTAGNYDSPKSLGTDIKTGINDYFYRAIDPKDYSRQVDADGNFILFYYNGGELCIYNPNGIVGYTKARGTVIK